MEGERGGREGKEEGERRQRRERRERDGEIGGRERGADPPEQLPDLPDRGLEGDVADQDLGTRLLLVRLLLLVGHLVRPADERGQSRPVQTTEPQAGGGSAGTSGSTQWFTSRGTRPFTIGEKYDVEYLLN